MAERTQYKKPAKINPVSISVFGILGLLIYVATCLWPVLMIRSAAKGEILDQMPLLYRANLKPRPIAKKMIRKIRKDLVINLRKIGVRDKRLLIKILRTKKIIRITALFRKSAHFGLINKSYIFSVAPSAKMDATRVDW